ncbi:hypothetical protein HXX76_015447 [Chlamydomonas incerta]|uniref:SNF2 super family n=1 Tax=Chlamydomonas incerta TaxID=51695 RepID=A0A835VRM7_CHLIN|nr:hypothetical protein HXX76_015447 [Chlamydomonas incerta]|eukprot:KAG2423298.1 hypothetical protein HXX76_015447 [Chlamydomonas incerta]
MATDQGAGPSSRGAGPTGGLAAAIDLTQADDEGEEEAPDTAVLLGSFRTKVVGVRYYTGEANLDEMVLLIREPQNPYDRWAIRVDNIRGDKIGHISREQAAVLSPLIDAGQLRIEGLVQGAKGVYNMPIDIAAFAPPDAADATARRLRNGGIALGGAGAAGGGAAGGGGGAGGSSAAARVSMRVLTPTEVDRALDKLFDEVHSTAAMQPSMHPDPEVLSRLFPHQRVALAWMIARENDAGLPPFWERVDGGPAPRFRNSLVNFVEARRPAPVRGGILADDMGLGKTLTVIALIATNRPGLSALPPVTPLSLADPDPDREEGAAAVAVGQQRAAAGGGSAAGAGPSGAAGGGGGSAAAPAEVEKGTKKGGSKAAKGKAAAAAAAAADKKRKGKAAKGKGKAVQGGKRRRKAEASSDEDSEAEADEEEEVVEEEDGETDDDAALGEGDGSDGEYVPTPVRRRLAAAATRRGAAAAGGAASSRTAARVAAAATRAAGAAGPSAAAPAAAAAAAAGAAGPSNATRAPAARAAAAATAATAAASAATGELPRADGPRGTLIVCPVSVMSNWAQQLQEHTAGNLTVYQYHGAERSSSPKLLAAQDVVLTSYAVLGRDLAEGGGRSGLLAVRWLRVVLDEAHVIKNPRAKASRAAAQLNAERRWAVTGTPIQNRMQDLHGLLVFLKVDPLQDRSLFTRTIERPLKQGDPRAVKTVQVLMGALALRRTKDLRLGTAGRPLVALPSKTVRLVTVHLTREDRAKYDALELESRRIISHALAAESLLDNYISVLEIILRLRQVADAGCLCGRDPLPLADMLTAGGAAAGRRRGGAGGGPAAALSAAERSTLVELLTKGLQSQDDCSICLEPFNATACITRCKHIFCKPCIETSIVRAVDGACCPLCRGGLSLGELVELPPEAAAAVEGGGPATQAGSDVADPVAASAKVAALMAALRRAAAGQQAGGAAGGGGEAGGSSSGGGSSAGAAPIKSVVFSQFTGMLNLIGRALEAEGVPYVRLDGSTPAKARAGLMRAFASTAPDSPLVFLSSLKAGGVGMNLTAASAVHLMDPWWNPAVEEQAMDRVHRLGQTRHVEVYRYVAADTIEERMLVLQDRKRELASTAFDRRRAESGGRMQIEDVRLLMGL